MLCLLIREGRNKNDSRDAGGDGWMFILLGPDTTHPISFPPIWCCKEPGRGALRVDLVSGRL